MAHVRSHLNRGFIFDTGQKFKFLVLLVARLPWNSRTFLVNALRRWVMVLKRFFTLHTNFCATLRRGVWTVSYFTQGLPVNRLGTAWHRSLVQEQAREEVL